MGIFSFLNRGKVYRPTILLQQLEERIVLDAAVHQDVKNDSPAPDHAKDSLATPTAASNPTHVTGAEPPAPMPTKFDHVFSHEANAVLVANDFAKLHDVFADAKDSSTGIKLDSSSGSATTKVDSQITQTQSVVATDTAQTSAEQTLLKSVPIVSGADVVVKTDPAATSNTSVLSNSSTPNPTDVSPTLATKTTDQTLTNAQFTADATVTPTTLAAASLTTLAATGSPITYYVDSVAGSDSNSGTDASHPWKTLTKVENTLTGDQSDVTVLFKRGDTWNGELDIPGSGTPGHPFTLGAYGTGANPIINAGSNPHGIAAYNNNHDIVINGIDVTGGSDTGMIFYDTGEHNILIENLTVSHAAASGIYVGVDSVTIQNVTVVNNGSSGQDHGIYFGEGSSGVATNGLVNGVVAHDNQGFGVQFWDASSGTVENSLIYHNGLSGSGGGIAVGTYRANNPQNIGVHDNVVYNNINSGIYFEHVETGSAVKVYDNTFYGNGTSGTGAVDDGGSNQAGAKIYIENNIFSQNNTSEMYINSPSGVFVSDYNVFYHPTGTMIYWGSSSYSSTQWATYKSATGADAHSIYGNPNFTNPSGNDFSLLSTSPAIDKGFNFGSSYQDGLAPGSVWPSPVNLLNENSYGSGWEIGAYVYAGTTGTTVNHAPAGADKVVTMLEDGTYVVTAADFGFTDPLDNPANAFSSVKITQIETAGSLKLNGVDVTLNQVIAKTDIDAGLLKFSPAGNANGSAYSNFKFAVTDDGGIANGGVNTDQSPNSFTFNVTGVNDAPAGADKTVTMAANGSYVLTAADFGFTDPLDNPANAFSAVKITQLETAGTLKLNGVDVTLNQVITKANIDSGLLKFSPAAGASGTAYANFQFAVKDNGGTANGGINFDQSPNTFTFNVAGNVNHAPAGTDKVVTMLEDGTYVLTAADFGFTDPLDSPANSFSSVKITQLENEGSLKLNGVDVTLNQVIAKADIDAGLLKFSADANDNGTACANFQFAVMDNGGTANGGVNTDQSPNTLTFNVTSVNDAPAGTDKLVNVAGNGTYVVTAADFGFTDPLDNVANAFNAVKITQLETAGSLKLNGLDVTLNQVILKTDIDAGRLTFSPATGVSGAADAYGTGYASFKFAVRDDGGTANGGIRIDQSPNTFTFNVDSAGNVNHAPAGTDKVVTMLEDGTYAVTAADFGFTDPLDNPANNFSGVKITQLETAGSLKLNGIDVTLNQVIAKSDIDAGLLKFSPAGNANGSAYSNFKFAVTDDGGTANGGVNADQSPNSFTFNVTGVNDAPSGTDKTVNMAANGAYVLTAADFSFADALDNPANMFSSVKITQLETAGTLKLNGADVTLNQVISKTDIDAGLLAFAPAADAYGTGYSNFKFAVADNGGTANGGINTDQSPNSFTFNVTGGGTAGKTYYVDSVGGSDSNTGTDSSHPWKTLTKVENTLTGDQSDVTVLFKRGDTWNGELDIPGSGSPGHPFTLGAYGTGANPIINAGSNPHGIAAYNNNHDIVINGIDVTGGSDTGMIFYDTGEHNILIENLTVSHAAASGIYVGVDSVTVQNVTVVYNGSSGQDHGIYFGEGSSGVATNGLVNGVIAHDNQGFGVQFWDASSGTIENSLIYQNGISGTGGGIAVGTYFANNPQNISIHDNVVYNNTYYSGLYFENVETGSIIKAFNNTFYGNGSSADAWGGAVLDAGCQAGAKIYLENNIFSQDKYSELTINSPAGVFVDDYNLFYHPSGAEIRWNGVNYSATNFAQYQSTTGGDLHSFQGDPQFTGASTGNFTLLSTSPAINAGTNLGTVFQWGLSPSTSWPNSITTLNENNYGSGWEIGAYVYAG